ncbi:AraC family transcriptional regulator [Konateibacter massiliensis]|uniref:AraC family transcriptional regulator n=1 Tax=Konateibacter massiliensis TaxID=2002841 RepID=UPI000C162253|nr:AraC family transcriptional regulator [Konateibacter massiliensis]
MELIKIGSNGTHSRGFKVSRPNGYPYYLFLLIKTPALFTIGDKIVEAEPNSVIVYDINFPHYYSSCNTVYINDWIHFRAENEADYFESLNIPLNQVIKLRDDSVICELIRLMSNEFYSVNTNRIETTNLLLRTMFVKLSEVIGTDTSKIHANLHYNELVSLRKEIYSNPQMQWSVDMLADRLSLCDTYLQKIYKQTFGVSCMADVIACKISYAKDILSKTNMPVCEVAQECGYKNDVHFMRQFKKYVGVTPSQYRREL